MGLLKRIKPTYQINAYSPQSEGLQAFYKLFNYFPKNIEIININYNTFIIEVAKKVLNITGNCDQSCEI